MELLDQFKSYLLQGTNPPNKITVKNYLADVRKFIRWFETRFMRPFAPRLITKEIVTDFKTQISSHDSQSQLASASSIKRYLSSLRKFYQFLIAENLASFNPFEITTQETITATDVWRLKEFKNFLFLSHASKPTIKNYLADVRQFITWIETVYSLQGASDAATKAFEKIDKTLIEEYKNRLLYNAHFEPRSVNRKLSSLRKYFSWAASTGIFNRALSFDQVSQVQPVAESIIATATFPNQLTAKPQAQEQQATYSQFPPKRMLQKVGRGSNWLLDVLIFGPVAGGIVAIKYQFWKMTGRQVFGQTITQAKSRPISNHPLMPTSSARNSFSNLDSFITGQQRPRLISVSNLPKETYAPLSISTVNFTVARKILHHMRHTRPAWYKRYHSYPIVHYLHFAVFLVYATALGLTVYQAVVQSPNFQAPVLASLPASPPRMLAFQGKISDKTNNPITAEQTLRFGLYDSPTASASSLLWQETQAVQPDNNGNFKTMLGRNQPIYQSLLNDNPTLYLGITIGNDAELTPRQQIATVTYSQDAAKVQGLSPITDADAGTTNVLLALDSGGDLIVGGSASPRFEATGGEFTLAGNTLTLTTTEGTNGNVQIVPDGSGIVDIQKPIQNTTNYSNIPGVEGAVEFDDSVAILATTSAQSAFIINQNSTGDLISANSNGIAKFKVDFLGTGTFAADLAVNGNNLTSTSPTFNLLNRNVINLNIANDASNITIGASSGATTVNNNLRAQGGLTIPSNKNLTLEGFSQGAIPFLNNNKQFAQDENNFVWLQDSRRLGIGINAPLYRLDVRDGQTTGSVAQVFNTDQGADADGLRIQLGATAPGTGNNFISFVAGDDTVLGKITGNGSGNVIYNTSGADYAEYYKKADPGERFEQGDIVCITATNGVSKCSGGSSVLGIVSKTAGFVGAGNHDTDPDYVLVGIVGQLPAKVASESATIASGDPLAIGPGGVTKATGKGIIVGRALKDFNPATDQMVPVALNIGWYDPTIAINQAGNVLPEALQPQATGLVGSIIETIKLGMIEAQTISTQSLSVATDNISVGGQSLRDYIATIAKQTTSDLENQLFTRKLVSPIAEIAQVKTNVISPLADDANIALQFDSSKIQVINPKVSSTSAVASIDNEGNASFSGTLRAHRIIADEIDGLNIQAATISANYITNVTNIYNVASGNADTASSSANQLLAATSQGPTTNYAHISGDFANSPTFTAEFAKFNQGVIALGGSSFGDVGITGTLRVGDAMRISDTSINTVGTDLALQPLRQGNLSLMGGLVTIDTDGNANFSKDVTVRGKFAANMIVPVPDQDLLMQLPTNKSGKESKFEIQTGTGSAALTVNQYGDVVASGSGSFGNIAAKAFTIIRGAQADTSLTQTIAEGSGGTAIITANERERTIITPYMKPNSLIYVSPTSNTYGVTPYIARQTDNSFTIQIPYTVTRDIKLNWWIVN